MTQHTPTYGTEPIDWTGEITPLPRQGSVRPASGTGLGGMESDTRAAAGGGGNRVTGGTGGGSWTAGGLAGAESRNSTSGDWLYDPPRRLGSLRGNGGQTTESGGDGHSWPDIENHLPSDVVEAPVTMDEVYRGSLKALLARNVGNYVVATFLIGTQTTVSWEGILYDVGNDYLAIYQSGRDQYIVSDLYSLKYVEFYDTRRRELCDVLLSSENNG